MIRPASRGWHSSAGELAGPVQRRPQRLTRPTRPETSYVEDVQTSTEADNFDLSDLKSAVFPSAGPRIPTPSGSPKSGRPAQRRAQTVLEGQLVSARTPTPNGESRGAPSPRGSVQTSSPKGSKISTARESVEVGGDAEPKPMTRSKISVLRAKTVDGVSAGDLDSSDLQSAVFPSAGPRISTPSGSPKSGRPAQRRAQTVPEGQLVSARTPTPNGESRGAPSPRGSVQTSSPKGSKISTARESVEVGGDAEPKPMTRSKISVLRAKTVDGVSAGDLDSSDLQSAVLCSEDPDVSPPGSPKTAFPAQRRVQTVPEGQLWSARTASHGKSRGSATLPLPSPRGSRGKVEPIDAAVTSAGAPRLALPEHDGQDFVPVTQTRSESLSSKKASKGAPRLAMPEHDGQDIVFCRPGTG
ncbi:unnamed protein product [Cladocopium goreaui]|uniref:Uncharacterized protein n=1 Tax=Cladocopium goreaui TaxID=2562237 RepID=A0A9P1FV40_9DINO|nr:unnamed protein product [Cladocopium goreaui]